MWCGRLMRRGAAPRNTAVRVYNEWHYYSLPRIVPRVVVCVRPHTNLPYFADRLDTRSSSVSGNNNNNNNRLKKPSIRESELGETARPGGDFPRSGSGGSSSRSGSTVDYAGGASSGNKYAVDRDFSDEDEDAVNAGARRGGAVRQHTST